MLHLGPERVAGNIAHKTNVQFRNAMYAKIASISLKVTEIQTNQVAKYAQIDRQLRLLTRVMRGLAAAPARRVGGRELHRVCEGGRRGGVVPAVIHRCPLTLDALWNEYQNGIGGNKPARLFTRRERGGENKYKYLRRLIVWNCIKRLLLRGTTLEVAIARIHDVYGNISVTRIINRMRADERRGGHARLRA